IHKEIKKMKLLKNLLIASTALLTLNSCGNNEPITSYRGKVKFETISVSSKLGGRIQKLHVQAGQTVEKGDTLAMLDIPEVSARMMQAEGAILAAQGQLNLAHSGATKEQLSQINNQLESGKAQLEFAQGSFERLEAMMQDSLITQQQFDE